MPAARMKLPWEGEGPHRTTRRLGAPREGAAPAEPRLGLPDGLETAALGVADNVQTIPQIVGILEIEGDAWWGHGAPGSGGLPARGLPEKAQIFRQVEVEGQPWPVADQDSRAGREGGGAVA